MQRNAAISIFHEEMGLRNPWDPEQAAYLRKQIDAFDGSVWRGLAAYNWGRGRLRRWLNAGADPSKFERETREYIEAITVPPRAAIDAPRASPQLRDQFDARYGPGAAARALRR
jgi:soluble lytic murein transglycosylase-like protein